MIAPHFRVAKIIDLRTGLEIVKFVADERRRHPAREVAELFGVARRVIAIIADERGRQNTATCVGVILRGVIALIGPVRISDHHHLVVPGTALRHFVTHARIETIETIFLDFRHGPSPLAEQSGDGCVLARSIDDEFGGDHARHAFMCHDNATNGTCRFIDHKVCDLLPIEISDARFIIETATHTPFQERAACADDFDATLHHFFP